MLRHVGVLVASGTLFASHPTALAAKLPGAGPRPVAIVFEIDVTASVKAIDRRAARQAFAERLQALAHATRAPITVYLRKISHNSGPDGAFIGQGYYFIPQGPKLCGGSNEIYGGQCWDSYRASGPAQQRRRTSALERVVHVLRDSALQPEGAGTRIEPAFAAAGELLQEEHGERWLIAITDLEPSHAPSIPLPQLRLSGVHVDVVVPCRNTTLAQCDERENKWRRQLLTTGAASVHMFPTVEASLVLGAPA